MHKVLYELHIIVYVCMYVCMYVYTLHNLQPVYMFFTVASTSPMRQLPGKEHCSSSTHTHTHTLINLVLCKTPCLNLLGCTIRMHDVSATDIAFGAAWEQGHWCHACVPERAGPVGHCVDSEACMAGCSRCARKKRSSSLCAFCRPSAVTEP